MGYQSITTLRDSRKVTARRIMHQWESRERFSEDTRKVTTKEAEKMKYVRVESLRNMIEILKDNGKDLKDLEDLKRLSATTRKCRCDKARVLRIFNTDRTVADVTEVKSSYDNNFIYKVGEVVSVDNFDENRWNECSTGIHFFINFQEAVDY